MRYDIMVDIETLGTNPDSLVFQIAAAAFDIKTGKICDEYNVTADIQGNSHLNITGNTLKWWLKTNPTLLNSLLNNDKNYLTPHSLIISFHGWLHTLCKDNDVYLWGNGILFDNNILRTQMVNAGLSYPIHYRNDRDMRTIVELAAMKNKMTYIEYLNTFSKDPMLAHDAFYDIKHQIKVVTAAYGLLQGTN